MRDRIFWLGHSTVKITGEKVIYVDPWKLKSAEPADLILISHSHYDHLSAEDVAKIRKADTVILATPDAASALTGDVRALRPGDKVTVQGVAVEAVPSYNTNKAFHPRNNDWIGFVVTVGGQRIYYAGDTDVVPEMNHIRADIAIVPVGGTYTMTAEEAAQAVHAIRPKLAIPIHYGDIVGSRADAERFAALCQVPVDIKPVTR